MDRNIKLGFDPSAENDEDCKCSAYDEVTGNCTQTSYPCDFCYSSSSWLDDKIFD